MKRLLSDSTCLPHLIQVGHSCATKRDQYCKITGLYCSFCLYFIIIHSVFIKLSSMVHLFYLFTLSSLVYFCVYGCCPAYMSVCHACPCYPWRPEKHIRFPGLGLTPGCELHCRCWEPNPDPLQEQSVFLTGEPSPQPWLYMLNWVFNQVILGKIAYPGTYTCDIFRFQIHPKGVLFRIYSSESHHCGSCKAVLLCAAD